MNYLDKKVRKNYFVYSLIPFGLLIMGILFLVFAQNDVANSTNLNDGDAGFGYAAIGIVSILLFFVTSGIVAVLYFFDKKKDIKQ
ncbi:MULTISPECIES: hypothetical protein [Enterococcus]|uniref:hypothetical protein n=1 Tax=Enterococcus TaxID=1350 RepID=UPI000AF02393|nr:MULTISPECIES: hypothetical protein [Enterococcus]